MALRADTARHIIVGTTVVIFSAAAIGTAMRYQDRSSATDFILAAELPARDVSAAARLGASEPLSYRDGARGSGSDIATRLETTSAAGGGTAAAWTNRERGSAGNGGGSAAWWAGTSARLTPTSSRSHGGGSLSMPGSGYAVTGGARKERPATAAAPARGRGNTRGGGGNGNGGGGGTAPTAPVFNDHTPAVGDLLTGAPVALDAGPGKPGGGFDAGGLAHSPEPASLLLMATGVIGVLGAARRRRR